MQEPNKLFRKEAIDGQKKNALGEAMILPKTNHALLSGFLLIWFILLCVLLISSKFSNRATVRGWLVSSKASIDIFSKEQGSTLRSIQVINGQRVSKGETLASIIRSQTALVDEEVREQQLQSLNQQLKLLQNRKVILQQKYTQQIRLSDELDKGYQQKLVAIQQQAKHMTSQLEEAVAQEHALLRLLKRKTITQSIYQNQKEKRRSVQHSLAQQHSATIDLAQTMSTSLLNRKANAIDFDEQINLLESNYESIQQQIVRFKGAISYQINSPIDGMVHNIQVKSGEMLSIQTPLMQITPENNPLKAILYVPSAHSGFIQQQQSVHLKIAAFPYQKFGMHEAHIASISKNILLPSQVKQAPFALSEPVFLIEAELSKQTIQANGKINELKAGMVFQANIELSERSVWEWLLKPIHSLRGIN